MGEHFIWVWFSLFGSNKLLIEDNKNYGRILLGLCSVLFISVYFSFICIYLV